MEMEMAAFPITFLWEIISLFKRSLFLGAFVMISEKWMLSMVFTQSATLKLACNPFFLESEAFVFTLIPHARAPVWVAFTRSH